ncbi:hypothetical protein ASPCAL10025 [Aspergillus calidoustus]|uniref:Uncharacterized protein n=1 Tax=Aspergillus calidoustus TaxID=454130 RepID=A0A0U4ZAI2_ASPCI|nr:hypothetical protein ASPCAL10025 [Aspergillus calidoustus]
MYGTINNYKPVMNQAYNQTFNGPVVFAIENHADNTQGAEPDMEWLEGQVKLTCPRATNRDSQPPEKRLRFQFDVPIPERAATRDPVSPRELATFTIPVSDDPSRSLEVTIKEVNTPGMVSARPSGYVMRSHAC